jgi:protein involved in polysaccharide export with SLBB domain
MSKYTPSGLAFAIVLTLMNASSAADGDGTYLLGPQDRLMIRVHTLRKNVGEALAWPALSGEFTVGSDGSVSMPILGEVKASGLTTAAVADAISRALREKADLTELPSASVEVAQYRPFFVVGAVQQPGKYEFQPNLTVLQALSIAQGIVRPADLISGQKDLVNAEGSMRALRAERVVLLAKLARLTSEMDGADTVAFPADLTEQSNNPRIGAAMREETELFRVRRDALTEETAALHQAKTLLEQELTTLQSKTVALDRQYDVTNSELRQVRDLVQKGVAIASRQVAAESAQIMVENNRLDVQVARLRAQQGISQSARDANETVARFHREVVDAVVDTRAELEKNTEQLRTAEQLFQDAETWSPTTMLETGTPAAFFTVTRSVDSGPPTTRAATEADRLQPGDVLQVNVVRKPPRTLNAGDQYRSMEAPKSQQNPTAGGDKPKP